MVLARAIFRRARVLLIDEPGAGLDRQSRRHLFEVIRGLKDGRIIAIASHDETDAVRDTARQAIEKIMGPG